MTALLEVEEMSTGYAGVPVIRDLNLHVDEGEVVALLGPNGAGKTTTLLTTSALVPILAGDISSAGWSRNGATGCRRGELTRQGDRLYGRGTADNKGQHSINIAALDCVLKTRGRLGFNAMFLIETGEEIGSPGPARDLPRSTRTGSRPMC